MVTILSHKHQKLWIIHRFNTILMAFCIVIKSGTLEGAAKLGLGTLDGWMRYSISAENPVYVCCIQVQQTIVLPSFKLLVL